MPNRANVTVRLVPLKDFLLGIISKLRQSPASGILGKVSHIDYVSETVTPFQENSRASTQ